MKNETPCIEIYLAIYFWIVSLNYLFKSPVDKRQRFNFTDIFTIQIYTFRSRHSKLKHTHTNIYINNKHTHTHTYINTLTYTLIILNTHTHTHIHTQEDTHIDTKINTNTNTHMTKDISLFSILLYTKAHYANKHILTLTNTYYTWQSKNTMIHNL